MPLGMEVGLRPEDFVLLGTQPYLPKKEVEHGVEPQIFGPCLLWPNGWMDQDGTWHGSRPWSSPHCARWGHSCLPQKGSRASPNFRPIFIVAKRLNASRCHLVWRYASAQATLCYMGTQPLPQKGRSSTQFSAHVYCGQTAAWIKMPLVRRYTSADATWCSMWTQLPPEKRHNHPHPIFGPCLLWSHGWMDEDAASYGSRPRPRPHCTRPGPSSRERGTAAPSFRPMSIVATVAHLSYC